MIPNKEKEGWYYLAVKKTINIVKKNNIKISWQILLLELSPFF